MPATKPSQPALVPGCTLPIAVLDNLCARFRPCGLFVMLLRNDGGVIYADPSASPFFARYVRPSLEDRESCGQQLVQKLAQLTASSPVTAWNIVPGVETVAVPYVERRLLSGVFLLCAKSSAFKPADDLLAACGKLALDGIWVIQQAESVAACDPLSLQHQARLLLSAMRDQSRIGSLEQELDSLSGQLSNTYEELSLIYQISSGMRVNRRSTEFFKQTCLDVIETLGVRGMGVALCNPRTGEVEPSLYGTSVISPPRLKQLAADLLKAVRDRKGAVLVNDLLRDRAFRGMAEDVRRLIAVPLQRGDDIGGCIFGLDKASGDFDSVDAKLLASIASQSAIYLENASLYEDVHDLMMGLLHALTSAVDAKDAYTCGHSERVALLSRRLAHEIRLPDAQVERIYMAGILHDVGKIGVPESVLQKAGRLTPEEFEQMKRHPDIGARILSDIKQVEDIIPGVLHHHERYDGKGYPRGLAGRDIPLMGRIICLADCFDAMTSSRTYRRALPLEVALSEIRRCSGTQFDPSLAESFLRIGAENLRAILSDHQTQSKNQLQLQESLRAA